jgi:ketosteroid isomerase-like protein
MSQENVEIVRRMHEHMSGLNLAVQADNPEDQRELIEQVYAPDVEASWSTTNPETRTYRGYDGLMQAFSEWTGSFEEYYIDAIDFIAVGDHVVVPTRQRGTGKGSGVPVELDVVLLYTLRDRKITALREYDTLEQALEAAGLSE